MWRSVLVAPRMHPRHGRSGRSRRRPYGGSIQRCFAGLAAEGQLGNEAHGEGGEAHDQIERDQDYDESVQPLVRADTAQARKRPRPRRTTSLAAKAVLAPRSRRHPSKSLTSVPPQSALRGRSGQPRQRGSVRRKRTYRALPGPSARGKAQPRSRGLACGSEHAQAPRHPAVGQGHPPKVFVFQREIPNSIGSRIVPGANDRLRNGIDSRVDTISHLPRIG